MKRHRKRRQKPCLKPCHFSCRRRPDGERLDKWLSRQDSLGLTRSSLQNRMEHGDVTVNGRTVSKNYRQKAGDTILVTLPEPESLELQPENIPLDIVYEDDDLLVVNKPKGMVVHPAPGHSTGTLVHALLYHCGDRLSSINGVIRPESSTVSTALPVVC